MEIENKEMHPSVGEVVYRRVNGVYDPALSLERCNGDQSEGNGQPVEFDGEVGEGTRDCTTCVGQRVCFDGRGRCVLGGDGGSGATKQVSKALHLLGKKRTRRQCRWEE